MDAYDYRQTFVITACIYAVAALMRLPLFFVVPRKEAQKGISEELGQNITK